MARLRRVSINQVVIGKARDWQGVHDLVMKYAEDLYGLRHWDQDKEGWQIRNECRSTFMESFGLKPAQRLLISERCGESDEEFVLYLPFNRFYRSDIRNVELANRLSNVIDFSQASQRLRGDK